ncbi:MAG: hypothetical protein COT84_04215 [Chlamydiae bacterium CG10_big_fil_rev_8_21_14_0_10_35_9]|nr:MAG: hypothetical protein COT84_04215 [Chlamydiae bacterium CG10_big_fil_rev_8_21_14_0_10_35_9]
MNDYELIDSGNELKFERFGNLKLVRPCAQALWKKKMPKWEDVDATFDRKSLWKTQHKKPSWQVAIGEIALELKMTEFGHIGFFPEHLSILEKISPLVEKNDKVLNLFAYSGLMTLALAQKKAQLCHVDASKTTVDWARKNARINNLEKASIRWIVDDVMKFLKREVKRGSRYDGVVLDPPTFGRGAQGQVFKLERDINLLLELVKQVLSKEAKFVALSCHTPGISPLVLKQIFEGYFPASDFGELVILANKGRDLPCGSFAIFLK